MVDTLTLRRVANGWVIQPGTVGLSEFTHIAATPEDIAEHVIAWAQAQISEEQK